MNLHLIGVEGATPEESLFLLGPTSRVGISGPGSCTGRRPRSSSPGRRQPQPGPGVFLGGISGLYGGVLDTVIQRVIEILRSIPTIPLWMDWRPPFPTIGASRKSTSPSP